MTQEADARPPRWVLLALVVSVAIAVDLGAYVYLGAPFGGLFACSTGLALLGWRGTTYRARVELRTAVVPMLLSIVALMALTAEGWLGELPARLHARSPGWFPPGTCFDARSYLATSYALFALFTFGAYGAWRRHPLGEFLAWLVFCFACADGISHLAGSLMAVGAAHYFPGLLTSPVAVLLGALGVRVLLEDHRAAVRG